MQCVIFSVVATVLSIIAIVLSIIAIFFSAVSFPSTDQAKWQKKILKKICLFRHEIFHGVIIGVLTIYVLVNWNKCISMQFFQRFDGNNILFIVWIISLFLILYKINIQGYEVFGRVHKLENEFQDIDLRYQTDRLKIQQKEMPSAKTRKKDGPEDFAD